MPPRRSARVAEAHERACCALSPLPLGIVLAIFSLLPLDCRLRCLEVCRGWRAVLTAERSLWTRLVLPPCFTAPNAAEALLRAAALRAGGQLHTLHVSSPESVTFEAMLPVVTANGGALRELRVLGLGSQAPAQLQALLHAAPALETLHAAVFCTAAEARAMLRGEPPFAPLRMLFLALSAEHDEASLPAALEALAAHSSVAELRVVDTPLDTPAAMNAVVDVALSIRLSCLWLFHCSVVPASATALARLLAGGALTDLVVIGELELPDAPAAASLSATLLDNCASLTSVCLSFVSFWNDAATAVALLAALTGHSRLRKLNLAYNRADAGVNVAASAAALGALVAANAPALEEINLTYCNLGDVGLGPLVDALPSNMHLRTLLCPYNGISAAFARGRLLPAVRANTSLRKLVLIRPRPAEGDSSSNDSSDDGEEEEQQDDAARLLLAEMERTVAAREGAAAAQPQA